VYITPDLQHQLKLGWNNACNIRRVQFTSCSLSQIRALMASKKPFLRDVSIHTTFETDVTKAKNMLDLIADGTGAIESFSFLGYAGNKTAAKNLLIMNKHTLLSFEFYSVTPHDPHGLDLLEPQLLECPQLQYLQGHYSTGMVKRMRARGVNCISFSLS